MTEQELIERTFLIELRKAIYEEIAELQKLIADDYKEIETINKKLNCEVGSTEEKLMAMGYDLDELDEDNPFPPF
ncbi:MAG: hypothetical protein ACI3V2_04180 [Faecousia sp.]